MKSGIFIVLAGFIGGSAGVFSALYNSVSLGWAVLWACYWGFFFGLSAKIVDCLVYKKAILSKLGSYYQNWGVVGTMIGLIIMTGKIGVCLSSGETSAIKEQLAGFSICFLTSLVGVCFAILTSIIADYKGLE